MSNLWRRVLGEKSERPWEKGPPLFTALQQYDGSPEFDLPDQPEITESEICFAPGALDGIFTHHTGWSDESKRMELLDDLISALQRLVATNGDQARADLYNIFLGEGIVTHADALVERVVSQRKIRRDEITTHARWLVHNAAHREPLKMGIILLGLSGTEDDIADLKVTARHDEFALYAAVAASNIVDDPTDIWWEMARSVHGWGKIHLVERLGKHAGGRPDLQAWFLRHGCQNDVMEEYLAFTCATAGDLAGALAGDKFDDELIDGACRILGALLAGGPAEDIDSYAGGVFAMTRLLGLLVDRCDPISRLQFVCSVRRWLEWPPPVQEAAGESEQMAESTSEENKWVRRIGLGWTEQARAALSGQCDQIIQRTEWRERVRRAYLEGDDLTAWSVSICVGADLWEDAFQRLDHEPLNSTLYFHLMTSNDTARLRRVIEFAERRLPLDSMATGPSDHFGFGPEYEPHHCLDYLLQEMQLGETFSEALVAAGLRSPMTRNRNMAAAALEAHPASQWGEKARIALDQTLTDECDEKLRVRLTDLVKKAGAG
jgi:hypothetical protein